MNRVKTYLLLALLTVMFVLIGNLLGGRSGMTIALILAGIFNFLSYWYSDKFVLKLYRAKPLPLDKAPRIHEIVEELSARLKIPKPKLYIIDVDHPNAFATGRDPSHSAVVLTKGILKILDYRELRGVLSHELSHIKNRDILVGTLAATIAGAITYLAQMFRFLMFFGGGDDEENAGNIVLALAISILAPIAALIVQLAISRSREYLADETGAIASRDPMALASALRKISHYASKVPLREANPATSHLFIVNPLKGGGIESLFSTHPPVEKRIERLKEIARRLGNL